MADDVDVYIADLADPSKEGRTRYGYRDSSSSGWFTYAIGQKAGSWTEAATAPWWNYTAGRMAGAVEVANEFKRVMSLPPGRAAASYQNRGEPVVELLDEGPETLARRALEQRFLPALAEVFPGFAALPLCVRRALVDIVWNVGPGRIATSTQTATGIRAFTVLRRELAATPPDWDRVAAATHRHADTPHAEARNAWAAAMVLQAKAPAAVT